MGVGYLRPLYPNLWELTVLHIRDEKVIFPRGTLNPSKPQIRIFFAFFGVSKHFLNYMHDQIERVITLSDYLNEFWKIITSYQQIMSMSKYQSCWDWAWLIITSGERRLTLKGKLFQSVSNSCRQSKFW